MSLQTREFIFGPEPDPDPVEGAKNALRDLGIVNWKGEVLENGSELIIFDDIPNAETLKILTVAGFRTRGGSP